MTTPATNPPATHLNGVAHRAPAPQRARGSGRIWIAMICGFLGLNMSIVAITVYLAVADKSVAVEPDYYNKALHFDETVRQRAANERLGWTLAPTLRPAADGRSMELSVSITDRAGQPVSGAKVQAVAFASARAANRQALTPTAQPDHSYTAPIRIDRPGLWRFQLTATRGEDTATRDTDLLIPDTAR